MPPSATTTHHHGAPSPYRSTVVGCGVLVVALCFVAWLVSVPPSIHPVAADTPDNGVETSSVDAVGNGAVSNAASNGGGHLRPTHTAAARPPLGTGAGEPPDGAATTPMMMSMAFDDVQPTPGEVGRVRVTSAAIASPSPATAAATTGANVPAAETRRSRLPSSVSESAKRRLKRTAAEAALDLWELRTQNATEGAVVECGDVLACLFGGSSDDAINLPLLPGRRVSIGSHAAERNASTLPFLSFAAVDKPSTVGLLHMQIDSLETPIQVAMLWINNPRGGRLLNGSLPDVSAFDSQTAKEGWRLVDVAALVAKLRRLAGRVIVRTGWGAYHDTLAGSWNGMLDEFMALQPPLPYFFVSSPDVKYPNRTMQKLAQFLNSESGLSPPVNTSSDDSLIAEGFAAPPQLWQIAFQIRRVPLWNVIVGNRALLSAAGRFDETFFPMYWDDSDYEDRLRFFGIAVKKVPPTVAVAWHPPQGHTWSKKTPAEAAWQCRFVCLGQTLNVAYFFYKQCAAQRDRNRTLLFPEPFSSSDADNDALSSLRRERREVLLGRGRVYHALCPECNLSERARAKLKQQQQATGTGRYKGWHPITVSAVKQCTHPRVSLARFLAFANNTEQRY